MARRCELTAKGPMVGHKVSHSNIKTKRRFLPNLCNVTFISDALGRNVRLRVSTNAIKSVDHRGGLDAFLIKAKADVLSPRALELKKAIEASWARWQSDAASRGVIARRHPYTYEMGMGHAVENYEWDGLAMPGRVVDLTKAQASEEPMRNLYRRWAQFMEADSWDELMPWRHAASRVPQAAK